MSILSRFRSRRSPEVACARALFAGQRLPPGAPASQQALARLLRAAAAPGTARELAGEVAAAAAFVQVTSQRKPRRNVRRVLAAAACAVAVGGTAVYAGVAPSPHHKMVPLPFGVPAHHAAPATGPPARAAGLPASWGSCRQATPGGCWSSGCRAVLAGGNAGYLPGAAARWRDAGPGGGDGAGIPPAHYRPPPRGGAAGLTAWRAFGPVAWPCGRAGDLPGRRGGILLAAGAGAA